MKRRLIKKGLPTAAAFAALLGSGAANALTIGFDVGSDGTYETLVTDNLSSEDDNGLAGIIEFDGLVGGFSVNLTIGTNLGGPSPFLSLT